MAKNEQSRLLVGAKAFARSLLPIALAVFAAYHKGLLALTPETVPHQAGTWIDLLEIFLTGATVKGLLSTATAKSVEVKGK